MEHIYDEMEVMVSCGDWIEVEDKYGIRVRGWLVYAYDENDSLFEFQDKEVDRILGGGFVQGLILRDLDRGLKEVKIPLEIMVNIERMDKTFLRLEDYEALVDLALVLKDKVMFEEYSRMVRFIRQIKKGVENSR